MVWVNFATQFGIQKAPQAFSNQADIDSKSSGAHFGHIWLHLIDLGCFFKTFLIMQLYLILHANLMRLAVVFRPRSCINSKMALS